MRDSQDFTSVKHVSGVELCDGAYV